VKSISAKTMQYGNVFGYSYSKEDRSVFSQRSGFSRHKSVMLSRITLNLPAVGALKLYFNHIRIEPKVNGSSYTWELGGFRLCRKSR